MFCFDFHNNILEQTKGSFIFGMVGNVVKAVLEGEENDNVIYNQVKAFRNTIEETQFNIIYNSFEYVFDVYKANDNIKAILSMFITTYVIGLRNGTRYALKSGLFSCFIYFLHRIVGK